MLRKNNAPQSTAGFIFECTMAVLYLAIAYALLFTSVFNAAIQAPTIRMALGGLLAIYGLFRVIRAVRKILERRKD